MFKRTYYVQRAERRNDGERVLRDTSFSTFMCILFIFTLFTLLIVIIANWKALFLVENEEIEQFIVDEPSDTEFERMVIPRGDNEGEEIIWDFDIISTPETTIIEASTEIKTEEIFSSTESTFMTETSSELPTDTSSTLDDTSISTDSTTETSTLSIESDFASAFSSSSSYWTTETTDIVNYSPSTETETTESVISSETDVQSTEPRFGISTEIFSSTESSFMTETSSELPTDFANGISSSTSLFTTETTDIISNNPSMGTETTESVISSESDSGTTNSLFSSSDSTESTFSFDINDSGQSQNSQESLNNWILSKRTNSELSPANFELSTKNLSETVTTEDTQSAESRIYNAVLSDNKYGTTSSDLRRDAETSSTDLIDLDVTETDNSYLTARYRGANYQSRTIREILTTTVTNKPELITTNSENNIETESETRGEIIQAYNTVRPKVNDVNELSKVNDGFYNKENFKEIVDEPMGEVDY